MKHVRRHVHLFAVALLLTGCGVDGASSSPPDDRERGAVAAQDGGGADGLVALCDTMQGLLDEAAGGLSGVMAQLTIGDPVRFSESAMLRALDESSDLLIEVHEAISGTRWDDKTTRIRSAVAEVDQLPVGGSLEQQGDLLDWVKLSSDPLQEMNDDCEGLVRDDAANRRTEFLDGVD